MKTTVLIPAYNEAEKIARTLKRLPRDLVDPIVLLNGCTDGTRRVVDSYNVRSQSYDERGKLPAIQATLRKMGTAALEPILLLDADTCPIFPRSWHNVMTRALSLEDRPTYVGGPVIFTPRQEGVIGESVALSAFRMLDGIQRSRTDVAQGDAAYYGPNQAIKIGESQILEEILELPHYWPKEDLAMAKEIASEDRGVMRQVVNLRAAAFSQVSDAMPPLHHWITKGIDEVDKEITARYRINAPEDSVEYTAV